VGRKFSPSPYRLQDEAQFQAAPPFFLAFIPWFLYLSTLSPGIDFRDSPEFVGTAFALGISHPAGFPTYNLLAKALTYLPLGSVAFKVNLFSALFACLTLLMLFFCARRLLTLLYPEEAPSRFTGYALAPAGLLAFSLPFWNQSVVAEVYTLHAFFLCLLLYLLIVWRQSDDVRWLYAAALVYGLSAGNHATVAFLLPALLIVFFLWNRRQAGRHLAAVVLIFLVGLSVYAYLPVRSLTEPSFDWGNPETADNFIYQVTDRKDADTHFSHVRKSAGAVTPGEPATVVSQVKRVVAAARAVLRGLLRDLGTHLTPWVSMGFLAGAVICLRKNPPLFLFLIIAAAFNASFFNGWGRESFFPSYIVACLLTSLCLYRLLRPEGDPRGAAEGVPANEPSPSLSGKAPGRGFRYLLETGKSLVMAALFLTLPWLVARNYAAVDRSGQYFAETLLKREFLSLDNHALFVPGMSWFNFHYHNDVTRLRDDVVAMNAWDFLAEDPAGIFTARRYPDLRLPGPEHRFASREETLRYIEELFSRNVPTRPILIEQNAFFFEQLPLADEFRPHRNLLVKYEGPGASSEGVFPSERALEEFKAFLEDEIAQPDILASMNKEWVTKVSFFIPSFARHYHARGMYAEERKALALLFEFLGQKTPDTYLMFVDNLVLDGRADEARVKWDEMAERFPNSPATRLAEGLVARAEDRPEEALEAFQKAMAGNPEDFRPAIEAAVALLHLGEREKSTQLARAALTRAKNLREINFIRDKMKPPPIGGMEVSPPQ